MSNLSYAIKRAEELVKKYKTRDPLKIAAELGIIVKDYDFNHQKGVYVTFDDCRMIFLSSDLDDEERKIVAAHELGHDQINRENAVYLGRMSDDTVFSLSKNSLENEANAFAAQLLIPDDEILDYIEEGYNLAQAAAAMQTDKNLLAMKIKLLSDYGGYKFSNFDIKADFLR